MKKVKIKKKHTAEWWFNRAGMAAFVYVVVYIVLLFLSGCAPKKEVTNLKADLQRQSEANAQLTGTLTTYQTQMNDYSRKVDSTRTANSLLTSTNTALQAQNSTLQQEINHSTYAVEYYESGQKKSESGSNLNKTTAAQTTAYQARITELTQQLNEANYYAERLDSTAAALYNDNMTWADNYTVLASEKQSLQQQITKQTGLTWWQKTLMYSGAAFWLLLIGFGVWKWKFGK
jgi:chromosome segregation ATPase